MFDLPLGTQITDTDTERTAMYVAERERTASRANASSMSAFIASLNINIVIDALADVQVNRVAQLTERTNQFNPCKNILAPSQVAELPHVHTVTVTDRFGYYGLVGAISMADESLSESFGCKSDDGVDSQPRQV